MPTDTAREAELRSEVETLKSQLAAAQAQAATANSAPTPPPAATAAAGDGETQQELQAARAEIIHLTEAVGELPGRFSQKVMSSHMDTHSHSAYMTRQWLLA